MYFLDLQPRHFLPLKFQNNTHASGQWPPLGFEGNNVFDNEIMSKKWVMKTYLKRTGYSHVKPWRRKPRARESPPKSNGSCSPRTDWGLPSHAKSNTSHHEDTAAGKKPSLHRPTHHSSCWTNCKSTPHTLHLFRERKGCWCSSRAPPTPGPQEMCVQTTRLQFGERRGNMYHLQKLMDPHERLVLSEMLQWCQDDIQYRKPEHNICRKQKPCYCSYTR